MAKKITLEVDEDELELITFSLYLNRLDLEKSLSMSEKVKDYDEDTAKRYAKLKHEVDTAAQLFVTLSNMKYGSKVGENV